MDFQMRPTVAVVRLILSGTLTVKQRDRIVVGCPDRLSALFRQIAWRCRVCVSLECVSIVSPLRSAVVCGGQPPICVVVLMRASAVILYTRDVRTMWSLLHSLRIIVPAAGAGAVIDSSENRLPADSNTRAALRAARLHLMAKADDAQQWSAEARFCTACLPFRVLLPLTHTRSESTHNCEHHHYPAR